MLSNLEEIENYCLEDNWNGSDEYAIRKETIQAAKAFMVSTSIKPDEIHAEETGYIRLVFYVSGKHNVELLIHEDVHTVALFTPEVNIDKNIQNKHIKKTGINLEHLTTAYQYFC
jgi:hypothetical protein